MITAFLGLRLYAVLGKRTGHEQSMGKPADGSSPVKLPLPVAEESADTPPIRTAELDPLDQRC
jgi:hypothetical protein